MGKDRNYTVIFEARAKKEFDSITGEIKDKISDKIHSLSSDPRPSGVKKLKGSKNEYRVRVGDYRILYSIQDKIVLVEILRVAHRRDVYEH